MSTDASKAGYRIYVVEDSAILLRLLLELLSDIPGVFVVGHSGQAEEAILEIGESTPDAIIVDLMLQSGTGFDVLEAVARRGAKPPMAIVLTNLTMGPYQDRARSLGAAHFFDKSTEILQMIRVISGWVEDQQRRSPSNPNPG